MTSKSIVTKTNDSVEELRVIELLSGPISLSYHEGIEGKEIFILGDEHRSWTGQCDPCKLPTCYKIGDFLDIVFRNTKNIIDYYQEIPYVFKTSGAPPTDVYKNLENMDTFGSIGNKFAMCFNPDKTECQTIYPNVRFHYADLRSVYLRQYETRNTQLYKNFEGLLMMERINYDIIKAYWETRDKTIKEKLYKESMYLIKHFDMDRYGQFINGYMDADNMKNHLENTILQSDFFKHFMRNILEVTFTVEDLIQENKIKKQLEKIEESNLRIKLYNFIQSKFKKGVNEFEIALNNMRNIRTKTMDEYMEKMSSIFMEKSIVIHGTFMDAYLLPRLFRTDLRDSKEVWIFVGEDHAVTYREFMSKYYNKKYLISKTISKRCRKLKFKDYSQDYPYGVE
jgi:hypothetical protein